MAKFRITGPDGASYDVDAPEGASEADAIDYVKRTYYSSPAPKPEQLPLVDVSKPTNDVRAAIAALPKDQRSTALKQWAKSYVDRERKQGGVGLAADDMLRQVARGTPVGSWLDEANAVTNAGLHTVSGGRLGAPYDESVAYQRARDEAADANSTKLATLPVIGDVTMGGVRKLAGAVASAPVTPVVRAMQGATMLPQMVNAGLTGAAIGGVYGAGEGSGTERVGNAALGGGIGLGFGAITPLASLGVSRLMSRTPRARGTLADTSPRAVERVADDISADDLNRTAMQRQAQQLGPEGVLADMGPNLQGHAAAIARMPGPGRPVVTRTLGSTVRDGRRAGAVQRINRDINAALGPPQDLVQLEQNVVRQANQQARPFYRQFEQTVIPPDGRLGRLVDRFQGVPGAVQRVERMMQAEGYRPANAMTGRDWDYMRRAVSDAAQDAAPGSNEQRVYRNLARQMNLELDLVMRRMSRRAGGPYQSVYQQARETAAGGQQFREGLQLGGDAFKKGTHPDQMRADLGRMSPAGQDGFRAGARGAIRDMTGNAATQFGATGDAAAMRALNTGYSQDKLAQIVSPADSRLIMRRLLNEGTFEQTRQAAVGNSVTAAMQANMRRYNATNTPQVPALPSNLWSDVKNGVRWMVNKMSAGYLDERSQREALDAARMLMAQGPLRDQVISDLSDYIARRSASQTQRQAAEDLLRVLLEGQRQPAISNAAGQRQQQP